VLKVLKQKRIRKSVEVEENRIKSGIHPQQMGRSMRAGLGFEDGRVKANLSKNSKVKRWGAVRNI